MEEEYNFTRYELATAFTEWERRYREEPRRFQMEIEKLAESPETYGDACAPYLLKLLKEQKEKEEQIPEPPPV